MYRNDQRGQHGPAAGGRYARHYPWIQVQHIRFLGEHSPTHRRFRQNTAAPGALPDGQDKRCEALTAEGEPDHADNAASALLQRMNDKMSRRQWYLLNRHCGLVELRRPLTLGGDGRWLGVSKERLTQIKSQALGRLRATFSSVVEQLCN